MSILWCRHCDICLEGDELVQVDLTNGEEDYICPYCNQHASQLNDDDLIQIHCGFNPQAEEQ